MTNETITLRGLTFAVTKEDDTDADQPWSRDDNHGPVREVSPNFTGYMDKRPGERILKYEFNRYGWAYDVQAATKIARTDWGVSAETRIAFVEKHGRDMTRGEIAALAVEQDFDRLRRWLNDDWSYIGVIVELLDVDGGRTLLTESLWGIESDSPEYLEEVAHELAEQLAHNIGRKKYHTQGARRIRIRN